MSIVTILEGDGIGFEIMEPAVAVLKATAEKFNIPVSLNYKLIGGIAIDKTGNPLPEETLLSCKESKGVLLGAVGGPKWENGKVRPEQGLLALRQGLSLYANLRPALIYSPLKKASPLKDEILGEGLDILVVRELTGGIYFGESGTKEIDNEIYAYDIEEYSVSEIKRIAHVAFKSALGRKKRLCSVDKANVLESSRLWRKTVLEVSKEYPDVELSNMYVDNAAMQLVRNPNQFDVILTNNIFGDILSDEASQITGSIGMLASASIGEGGLGLYEPIHGSAPDIAGKNIANPIAMILSVAMLFRYSFNNENAAKTIEDAVERILIDGVRTADIAIGNEKVIGTKEIGELILKELLKK